MKRTKLIMLNLCALFTVLVFGACTSLGERIIEGEVITVSGDSITVKTMEGTNDTFIVNDATQITLGNSGDEGDALGNSVEASSDKDGKPPAKPEGETTSGGNSVSENDGEPPAKPDGEARDDNNVGEPPVKSEEDPNAVTSNNSHNASEPPAKPSDSNAEERTPPEGNGMPGQGDMRLSAGMHVKVEVSSNNIATSVEITSMGPEGGHGGGQAPTEYAAAYTFDESSTVSNETLESTGTDENVVLVDKDIAVTLDGDSIVRTSSDSTGGDSASFYGVGAALLATDGNLNVNDCEISTDAKGGAGAFAYGNGVVNILNTNITTKQDTSGGIHVAGGGTLNAVNVNAETSGESSAPIRSDRGSGKMNVEGGNFTSNGTGSPAIYSTADITVNNAKLTANNSEAICIEGFNSIKLLNCNLTGNQPDDERNEIDWNVILYQSMSGDSQEGNATFNMEGGKLTAKHGGMFYTTNTESTFIIKNVDITYSKDNPFLLRCTGNSNKRGWGSTGSNGADCKFTAIQQQLKGDVQWDSISRLEMSLTEGSGLRGAFIQDESAAGNGGEGYANLTIDKNSSWVVTDNSTLGTLTNNGKIIDASGKSVTIKDTSGKVLVKGISEYTVTVNEMK